MALTTINSSGIKDDSLVNADIKSDAAIALSKLASTPAVLTGSTNNTICTVTAANTIQGEANLTFDAGLLKIDDLSGTAGKGRLEFGNSGEQYIEGYDTGNGGSGSYLSIGDGGAEHLRIDASGNVGIGTSPDNTLHLLYSDSQTYNTDIRNAGLQIENNDGTDNTYAQIHLRVGNADAYLRAIREGSNLTSLAFLTDNGGSSSNAGEAMRIDSSGRLGIGTTSMSSALNVYHATNNEMAKFESGDEYVHIVFKDSTTTNEPYMGAQGNNLRFITGGAERLRVQSGGDVNITDGDLVIGTSGHGIDFSANSHASGMSSETLDSYEEGTWTPTLKSGDNTISYDTGSSTRFSYTKIGNTCHIWFTLDNRTTSGTIGDGFAVEGLPFTSVGGRQSNGTGVWYGSGFRLSEWPVATHIGSGASKVQFYHKSSAAGNYFGVDVANVGASSYLFFTLTYETT